MRGRRARIDPELAALIPPLADEERAQLEANIVAEGCRDALVTWRGVLLDGHNRYEICTRLGIEYRTAEAAGVTTRAQAMDWIDANQLGRRNLTPDAFKLLLGRRYNRAKKAANDGGKGTPKSATVDQIDPRFTADRLAAEHGVSAATVKRAGQFAAQVEKTPQLAQAIKERRPVTQVKRELKESKREQRREHNRALIEKVQSPIDALAAARFSAILIDPPWDWGDEGDCDQLGRARPTYATQPFCDLLELPVAGFADTDCHLYLWITNRSLPKGFALIERWGFRYITTLTWCKPSIGMGNYFRGSTEHLLFAVKGSQELKRKDVGTWFSAPRGPRGHSSKPHESYELIESCSPGPYLEMYARGGRPGWTFWGAQANAA